MTPCEELDYKVGDVFRVVRKGNFLKDSVVKLTTDDGSTYPPFDLVTGGLTDENDLSNWGYEDLDYLEKVFIAEVPNENPTKKHSHYFKPVEHLTEVDVYRVCDIFQVDDCSGATQHAIKKLLLPGQRGGGKSTRKDIKEAVDTLTRKLEMLDEDERNDSHELSISRV